MNYLMRLLTMLLRKVSEHRIKDRDQRWACNLWDVRRTSSRSAYNRYLQSVEQFTLVKRRDQELFLATLAQCGSPGMACQLTGIARHRYLRWRKKDPWFMQRLNEVIDDLHEQLAWAALSRATGYFQDDGNGDIAVDGIGAPVMVGASDRLAAAILNLNNKDQGDDADVVNIEIVTGPDVAIDHADAGAGADANGGVTN